jgi:ubiquinone/menaquinone biosynthesis C-methylase UbiE
MSEGTASADLTQRVKSYNRIYHDVESDFYDEIHPEIFQYEQRIWSRLTADLAGRLRTSAPLCLDAGTGSGFVPEAFSREFPDARWICLDTSVEMLGRLRSRLSTRIALQPVGADCEFLPFRSGTFDLVTANSVLHHLPNVRSFLSESHRVLKRGGHLVIAHEPNRLHYRNPLLSVASKIVVRARRVWGRKAPQGDVGRRKERFRRKLEARFREEGFDVSYDEISRFVDLHSPTAGRSLDPSRGFVPRQLVADKAWDRIQTRTYAHLGKGALGDPGLFIGLFDRCFSWMFPRQGALFFMMVQK